MLDVAVVGAGPAGLAAAIEAARRGLSVRVFERRGAAPDKACGEGLMPAGRRALESIGALAHVGPGEGADFAGIRYVQEDGAEVSARFADGKGLGLRRVALVSALERAAEGAGVAVEHSREVAGVAQSEDAVRFDAGGERVRARVLVAADGLHSPVRRALGLEGAPGSRRCGLRRHFRGVATSGFVDVHWADGVEAYVTPVGEGRCGVAFLFDAERVKGASFDALLARFPRLASQLAGGEADSAVRGAGPLWRRARAGVAGRVVLLGDAAGYVDAITGEGLTLAFGAAAALGEALPLALRDPRAGLARYERARRRAFAKYAAVAAGLVWVSSRPRLRRAALGLLARAPGVFALALRAAV